MKECISCFFNAPRVLWGIHTNVNKRSARLCLTVLVGYQKLSDYNLLKDIQQLWLIKEIRQQYFSISPPTPPLKLKHFQAAGLNPALSKCLISLHGISTHWLPPNGADFSSQPSNNSPEQPGADGTNATRESRFIILKSVKYLDVSRALAAAPPGPFPSSRTIDLPMIRQTDPTVSDGETLNSHGHCSC